MDENVTMIEVEENNDNVEMICCENDSTLGEKALGVAILTLAVTGAVSVGKWVVGKCKKAKANRKAKKIREAEFVELEGEECESANESD